MTQCYLVGSYEKEEVFIEKLNEVVANWDYDNLEIQYQALLNENELLYNALVIVKNVNKACKGVSDERD